MSNELAPGNFFLTHGKPAFYERASVEYSTCQERMVFNQQRHPIGGRPPTRATLREPLDCFSEEPHGWAEQMRGLIARACTSPRLQVIHPVVVESFDRLEGVLVNDRVVSGWECPQYGRKAALGSELQVVGQIQQQSRSIPTARRQSDSGIDVIPESNVVPGNKVGLGGIGYVR